MNRRILMAVAMTSSVVSAQQGGAPVQVRGTTIAPKVACAAMAGVPIPSSRIGLPVGGVKITSATLNAGTGPSALAANYVPEYCEINGVIAPVDPKAPAINFQVNIPTRWNQMAWQFGADGSDGYVPSMVVIVRDTNQAPLGWTFPPDMPFPIARGYATCGGDGGHQIARPEGGGPIPGQFRYPELPPAAGSLEPHVMAARKAETDRRTTGPAPVVPPENDRWQGNDEAFTNFAHAHVKKTHDAAQAVIQHMYGTRPRFTYFTGNSNGGKSALQALSRYGADYDGILSTVAIPYDAARAISQDYLRHLQRAPGAWVPPAKSAAVRNEIVRQCDLLDNLADGVISNYADCRRLMDPTITPNPLARIRCDGGVDTGNTCLSDAQMATVNAFHAPTRIGFPMANGESDFPGWPVGAEAPAAWLVTPNNPANAPAGGNDMLLARVPGWDPAKLGAPSDITPAVQALSRTVDPLEAWPAFLKRGGKLVLYHAASDYQVNAHGMFRFFEQAGKKNDAALFGRNVRFYVAPNVGHGSYGISATTGEPIPPYVDLFTVLADWVEKGTAPPEAVLQTLKQVNPPYAVTVSRPLCRYPSYPRYTGTGDPKQAGSYRCTAPASR